MNWAGLQIAILTLAGCAAAPWLSAVPRPFFQVLGALLLWPLWRTRGTRTFTILFLAGLFFLAALSWRLDRQWPADSVHFWRSAQRINLEGWVAAPPQAVEQGSKLRVSFVLRTEARIYFEGDTKRRSPVSGKVEVRLYQCGKVPEYGDAVVVFGVLSEARAQSNPAGYDERRRLAEQGLDSVLKGYGLKALIVTGRSPARNRILERIYGFRKFLSRRISNIWEPRAAGYFKALILGEREGVPPNAKEAFVRTSTAHILAISGLHFSLIGGAFFLMLAELRVRLRAAAFLSLVFLCVYVFLAGASIPVVRAGVMAGLLMMAVLLERESQGLQLLCFAFSAFLLLDSRILTSVSFQLSFLAVFFLLVFSRYSRSGTDPVWSGIKACVVVVAGTFPVTAAVFHGFSLTAIPANLTAVPLFNTALLFALAALVCFPVPLAGTLAAGAAAFFLKAGLAAVAFFSAIPGSYLPVESPPLWKTAAYVFFALLAAAQAVSRHAFLVRFRGFILSGWILCGVCFFLPHSKETSQSFCILETRAHPLIQVTFGPHQNWIFCRMNNRFQEEARWSLRPYLRSLGIRRLEGVVALEKASRPRSVQSLEELAGVPVHFWTQVLSRGEVRKKEDFAEGSRVRFAKEPGGFEILGLVKGRAILHFWTGECDVLVIPPLSADTFAQLQRLRPLVNDSEVLVFPRLTQAAMPYLEKIVSWVDPAVVIVPDRKHWPQTIAVKRVLFQSETGAVHFEVDGRALYCKTHKGAFFQPPRGLPGRTI